MQTIKFRWGSFSYYKLSYKEYMTSRLSKSYFIKIQKEICIFQHTNNIFTFVGPFGIKSIKIPNKVVVSIARPFLIEISNVSLKNISKNEFKLFKKHQKTFVGLILQTLSEVLRKSKKKLTLIGIGYRASVFKYTKFSILQLKLGFSHHIYIKIPKNLYVFTPKSSKILIFGSSQKKVDNLAALIKFYKIPEPYKGKGIFYENETITLKQGKKI